MAIGDGTLAKGFAYQWNPTKLSSDSVAFNKTIIENFRQLQTFINGYVITKTSDGVTVPVTDLLVAGELALAAAPVFTDGPEHANIYRNTTQAITGGGWEKLNFDTVNGTSGAVMTEDVTTDRSITVGQPGIYLVRAQVIFDTDENSYLRILQDGTERVRSSAYTRNTIDVCGVVAVTGVSGSEFTAEVFTDTAANAAAGTNNTFMTVTRLHGIG